MSTSTLTLGGWTTYAALTQQETDIFKTATAGLLGVKYTPKEVSKQVVAGTNYRFKCTTSIPHFGPGEALVEIFQPLEGEPYITDIKRM